MSEPSPYYQQLLEPFTLYFLLFQDTYESRRSEASVFGLVRWLECVVVYRIEKPRHDVVEECWPSILGVISDGCILLDASEDSRWTQEPVIVYYTYQVKLAKPSSRLVRSHSTGSPTPMSQWATGEFLSQLLLVRSRYHHRR